MRATKGGDAEGGIKDWILPTASPARSIAGASSSSDQAMKIPGLSLSQGH